MSNVPYKAVVNTADEQFLTALRALMGSQDSTEGNEVRTKWEDGTPAHARYINNVFFQYSGETPLISLRAQAWKSAIKEMLWIYQDQSNNLDLLKEKYGITWWDKWEVGKTRTIGARYGYTVKKYDLINKLIKGIKETPMSRRHIIDLYQYADFKETDGLYPCAMETIWTVRGEYLDVLLVQRSSDMCVALSINQFQYYALLVMIAKATGYEVGAFSHMIANLHIYDRHMEGAEEMIQRAPEVYEVATEKIKLEFNPKSNDFYSFTIDDFKLVNYNPINRQIKFELAE
jgi:thymidylate synthase